MMRRLGLLLLPGVALFASCSQEECSQPRTANHAPAIVAVGDTTAVMWDILFVRVSASDDDGDSLTFRLEPACDRGEEALGQCPRAGLCPMSGGVSVWFTPRSYDAPSRRFTVIADDGRGASGSADFRVAVEARVDTASFRAGARAATQSGQVQIRLFLIDHCLVFTEFERTGPHAILSYSLFGRTPEDLLCMRMGNGVTAEYPDSSYVPLFDMIVANLSSNGIDLGPWHEVEPIDF
jgi:hypothetical protein